MSKMDSMMKSPGMESLFENTTESTIEDLLAAEGASGGGGSIERKEERLIGKEGIAFQGPRNPFREAKDLVNLFRMGSSE